MARVHVDIQLRWGDQDEYGHVNNVSFARYLEEARVRVFSLGTGREHTGMEHLLEGTAENPHKMLVASQFIEFVSVLHYGERPAVVELWIGKLGGASFEVHAEIIDGGASERTVVARSITQVVVVDAHTLRPQRLTDEERAVMAPWVDEAVQPRRAP